MNLIEHVKKSVENSRNHISDIDDRVLAIEGMSNRKVRHLFNNITKIDNCNYLEIGCWKGSTCISALYKNKINKHWIIDNFSLFGGPREEFLTNFRTILGYEPNLIDKHYRSFDPVKDYGIENVNVYFYDGEHDDSNQSYALGHYMNSFSNEFIYICDDWFWWQVEKMTREAIRTLNLTILYEEVLPQRTKEDEDLWWNGLFVGILKKP